jgi:signal transduction histidine kinase
MAAARILLVDDEEHLLRVLRQVLKPRLEGVEIDVCASTEEALSRLASIEYDAILTDFLMQGTDGLALLRELRERCPSTPTLLMTGHGQHDLAVQAIRAGAFDFLEKPVDIEYLAAALRRAIRVRAVDRALEERQAALERHAGELAHIVEDQTRELREANRIKDEFLATLSHELRTPLTAILGWARLLVRGRLDKDLQAQAISSIERNATLQAHLIEDLLDVSRIMSGKLRLSMRQVQLSSVVSAAVDSVADSARARGIKLERHIEPSTATVKGDSDRLQQVVVNLLSNAIKFSPDGARVEVRLACDDECAQIVVLDEGPGISGDFLPHVFDRFRQGDSSVARSRGGLGLGLSIVRHLVDAHGGSVTAESAGPGKGATFRVTLPLSLETSHHENGAVRTYKRRTKEPSLKDVRVLVVDDEPDSRAVIRVSLERYGAHVTAVASGAQAVEAFDRELPDVMLCDIGMPQEDGYGLIRRIRARAPALGGRIPAAALTAYARTEDIRHALAEGFDVHLAKPIEPAVVALAVAHLVEQRRAQTMA